MTSEILHVLFLPLVACLILAGIHAYLGLHVLERGVIFVDLALAQIAALGAGVALVAGHGVDEPFSYALSLAFTLGGAFLLAIGRFKDKRIPQEALIGIFFAVASAALILVLSRSGEGDEHIREALTGRLLLVEKGEVLKLFLLYSAVGLFHFIFRSRFLLISRSGEEAAKTLNVRFWDFLFYASFGLVVTSSVQIAGVLLVFSLLVVPAACGALFARGIKERLLIGWSVAVLACFLGAGFSYGMDFPTGASVVCSLGVVFFLLVVAAKWRR